MSLRPALLILLASVGVSLGAGPVLPKPVLMQMAEQSAKDNIGSGWCGRAMLSLLRSAGLGDRLKPGNGQDWEKILREAGWRPKACATPLNAPLGSVLVYLGDARVGKRPRGTPGGYHGHVEMVALSKDGRRLYVADSPRTLPGGTVRDNFTGRAWLPPGPSIWKAPDVADQVAVVLEERKRMALAEFARQRGELAAARPLGGETGESL